MSCCSEHIHIRIVDTTLRDGSHAMKHQFTLEDVKSIASALDEAGVYGIEIALQLATQLDFMYEKGNFDQRRLLCETVLKRLYVEDGKITGEPEYNAPFAIIARANGSGAVTSGGAEGTRTPDLLRAREALSQLSYSPTVNGIIAIKGLVRNLTKWLYRA